MLYLRHAMLSASLVLAHFSTGCSDNAFRPIAPANPAEDAAKALEKGHTAAAIRISLDALGSSYRVAYEGLSAAIAAGHAELARAELDTAAAESASSRMPALISILSSAHAKIYGIDPLDIALAMASDKASLTLAAKNDLAILYPVLPEGTTNNIQGLAGARLILDSMGHVNFQPADFFKKALYLTANVSLITKQLDRDGDGVISLLEAASMSENNAEIILDLLFNAANSVLTSGKDEGSTAAQSAAKIATLRETILTSPGSDDTEKLRNYLGNKAPDTEMPTTEEPADEAGVQAADEPADEDAP